MIHYNSLWETMSNICLDKVRIYFLVCLMELYCVFTIAVGTAGNFGFPAGALFL